MGLHRWQQVIGGLALALVVATLLLILRPSLVTAVPPLAVALEVLARIDGDTFGLLTGAMLVALLVLLVVFTSSDERDSTDQFTELRTRPPEAVTVTEAERTGAEFDETIDSVVGGRKSVDWVRDRLIDLATEVTAANRGIDAETAHTAVREGTWTDDRTAAAFLGDSGPTYTLWSRLRLWLDPETERQRRIEATVAAIRTHGGDPE